MIKMRKSIAALCALSLTFATVGSANAATNPRQLSVADMQKYIRQACEIAVPLASASFLLKLFRINVDTTELQTFVTQVCTAFNTPSKTRRVSRDGTVKVVFGGRVIEGKRVVR